MLKNVTGKSIGAFQAKFLADIGAVVFYSATVDGKFIADLFARFPIRQKKKHFLFGERELADSLYKLSIDRRVFLFRKNVGDRGADVNLS